MLDSNDLKGTLPANLGSLFRLKFFSINKNQLTGSIPSSVGGMAQLTCLQLSSNSFVGSLPTTLGSLTALETFSASSNQIQGSLPTSIGLMTSLVTLQLSLNSLGGPLPTTIGSLKRLKVFGIDNNRLTGTVPSQICNLPHDVGTLAINTNSFLCAPACLTTVNYAALKKDATCVLCGSSTADGNVLCDFYNTMPTTGQTLLTGWCAKNVEGSGSFVTDPCSTSPGWLGVTCQTVGGMVRITSLKLQSLALGGSLPPSIGGLNALTFLQLSGDSISGSLPTTIGLLTALQTLNLYSNLIAGSLPTTIGLLTALQTLTLSDNMLSGQLPSDIGSLTNLKSLQLGAYQPLYQDSSYYYATALPKGGNRLQGQLPSTLGGMKSLTYLDLTFNKFNGSDLFALCGLPSSTTILLGSYFRGVRNDGTYTYYPTCTTYSGRSLACLPGCLSGYTKIKNKPCSDYYYYNYGDRLDTSYYSSVPSCQTLAPSALPTLLPTLNASPNPTAVPSVPPTPQPTAVPSNALPTPRPTTSMPTLAPVRSVSPTPEPSPSPSKAPSVEPSALPTQPTSMPTIAPTAPTPEPSPAPTLQPSPKPTSWPSLAPTRPTAGPTSDPTTKPSVLPTASPTPQPSAPTSEPSPVPSTVPTVFPTAKPTPIPTRPTAGPTSDPTTKPSAIPTASPTPQPSAPTSEPSPAPSAAPTAFPTAKPTPTPYPTTHPTTRPTPHPSTQPTPRPTPKPSPRPSHAPSGSPSSSPSNQPTTHPTISPTARPTKFCGPGTASFDNGHLCLPCPAGTYSSSFGATSCSPCLPGSSSDAKSSHCTLCTKTAYQPNFGSSSCMACPLGRLTPFDGASSEASCLSPLSNFILGSFALLLAAILMFSYVICGRYRFASYIRRERVVMKQVSEYRSFMFYLTKFQEDIIYEIKKRKVDATLKKVFKGSDETSHRSSLVAIKDVFVIVCFTVLCVSVGTVFVVLCFILLVMKVFFNSLIIWKQSNSFLDLIDYRSAIMQVASALSDLFADWQFPSIVVSMIHSLLQLLQSVFDLLARFKIDLSVMNVTCQGSKDPFILLENLFILGCIIIVIESQMQVFRGLVFTTTLDKYNNILLSREYQELILSGKGCECVTLLLRYTYELIKLVVIQVLARILDFRSLLQFAVAQVQFSAFVSGQDHTMASTEACNKVPGAENFDYFLAIVTSGLAFAVVLPSIYEVAKVCCPNNPDRVRKMKEHKGSAEVQPAKQKNKKEKGFNAWSYLRLPLTFFAPDLLLAHFTSGLVYVFKQSIDFKQESSEEAQGSDPSRPKTLRQSLAILRAADAQAASEVASTSNPMISASNGESTDKPSSSHGSGFGSFVESKRENTVYAVVLSKLKSYYHYTTITLHPFSLKSIEGRKWSDMIKMGILPSYWDLLRFEAKALFGTPSPEDDDSSHSASFGYVASFAAACFLAVVPIGHFTLPGTTAAVEVISRFKHFFLALMGRWTADVVDAYDVKGQVERMAVDADDDEDIDMNRINTRFSHVLETTIGPRAILLQLVPWLTIWSVFSIATSGSAMWAKRDSGLFGDSAKREIDKPAKKKGKKKAKSEAQEEEEDKEPGTTGSSQGPGEAVAAGSSDLLFPYFIWYPDAFRRAEAEEKGRWKHRQLMMHIAAIRIIVLHSRAIQYLVSAYMTFVSVWVLFHPANKAVLASIVVILGPVALVQALGLVLILGKAMNVKDLKDIGSHGLIEKRILELKKKNKTKAEIKEALVIPPKKRELKVKEEKEKKWEDWDEETEEEELAEARHVSYRGDVEMTPREHHTSLSEVLFRDSIGPEFAPARQSIASEFGAALEKQPSALARHNNFSAVHGRLRIHNNQAAAAHPDQHHALPLGAAKPAEARDAEARDAEDARFASPGAQRVLHIQKRLPLPPHPTSSSASASASATTTTAAAAPILQGSALQGISRMPPGGFHRSDSVGLAHPHVNDSAAVSPIHVGRSLHVPNSRVVRVNDSRLSAPHHPTPSLSPSSPSVGDGPARKIKISAPGLKTPLPHDKDSSR